jgi:small subunit ribosomal protein S2
VANTTAQEVRSPLTVRELLDAGLHFGHQTKRWNPKMKKYIFDKRSGIHIIDLAKSLTCLQDALVFSREVAARGRTVLFVGTKKQAQQVIKDAAQSCGQPYVVQRWLGGTLTNNVTIRKSVKRMREIEALETSGQMAKLPKKEISTLRHELDKLRRNLSGIADMNETPGAIFIVDIQREAIAVQEANKLNVPVIAIVDTNCDPDPVKYVIPGNDDAIRGIKLISGAVSESVKTGASEYARVAAEITKRREIERAAEEARRTAVRAEARTKSSADGEKPPEGGDRSAKKPAREGDKSGAGRGRGASRKPAAQAASAAPAAAAPAAAAPAAAAPAAPAAPAEAPATPSAEASTAS